jgi:hypothetical protein
MLEGKDNPSRTLSFAFRNPLPEHERRKPEPATDSCKRSDWIGNGKSACRKSSPRVASILDGLWATWKLFYKTV